MNNADTIASAAHAAVEAAVWAPSIHNTQPWSFAVSGDEICLRADPDRKMRIGDPDGRQMLISCGAALFNVRVTLRALGWVPEVRVLPDPERPLLVATVRVRPPGLSTPVEEHATLLHAEIERRRTHRAGFTGLAVPDRLVAALVDAATAEGACLLPVVSKHAVRVLADLTSAAQEIQSQDRVYSLELLRWARPPGSARRDGVPAGAYPSGPARTSPQHFAQRDYARGHPWGIETDQRITSATGLVALLTTAGDGRRDWVAAGEALQRVLLHGSAYGLSAAFHTQALEMPELREFIRRNLSSGRFPQMVMRLGFVLDESRSVRRPSAEMTD
ncbi:hypothetical protein JOL79_07885 [Microbispora sp. RL4-1S]|uniref:Nitroreductase domain-containing protein n=1 Tax=Microbispora oryzae TaxID=2806554 RepID=A0A941AH57_9ACTN|nr:hypothetical protein [Microbispora oryzae]MBP2703721.1 hypothetical protein [Microbispora oryzae]